MTPPRLQHLRLSLINTLLQASALHLGASGLRLFSRPEPLPTALLPMTAAHIGTPLLLLTLGVAAAWPGSVARRVARTGLTFLLLTVTWPGKTLVIFLRDLFGPLPWPTPWAGLLVGAALLVGLVFSHTRPRTRHLRETDARLRSLAGLLDGWTSLGRAGLPEHGRVLVAPNGAAVTLHTAWGLEKHKSDGLSVTWLWPTEKQVRFLRSRGPRLLWVALAEGSQGQYRPKTWTDGQGQTLIGTPEVAAEHLHRLTGTLPQRPSTAPARPPAPPATPGPVRPAQAARPAGPTRPSRPTSPTVTAQATASPGAALKPPATPAAAADTTYSLPREVERSVDASRVLASPTEQMIRRLIHDAWHQLRTEMPWPVRVTGSHQAEIDHPGGPVQIRIWPHPDPAAPDHPDAELWTRLQDELRHERCVAWIWSPLLRPDGLPAALSRHIRELRGHARLLREALDEGDPFRLLGVTPSSSPQEVRHAYRTHIKALHPDHNPSPDAQALAARLNAAYRWLTEPGQ